MKRLLPIVLLMALTACSESGNEFLVSNKNEIYTFVESDIFKIDGTWNPKRIDRAEFNDALQGHVKKLREEEKDDWTLEKLSYIDENIDKYTIEYGGIIKDGKKLIFCAMHLIRELSPDYGQSNHFTLIYDGGASVLRVIYIPELKAVEFLGWNGEA